MTTLPDLMGRDGVSGGMGDPASPSGASSLRSPEPASGLGHSVTPPIAQWRPIETAPKDGRRFLFTNGAMVGTALYMGGKHFAADSWQGTRDTVPTHWQPLPTPPEEPVAERAP